MEEYIELYGRHFNKALFDYAVSMMEDRGGKKHVKMDKEECDRFFKDYSVEIKRGKGHDAAYVLNMAKSDYFGSSITEEPKLAKYVQDYIDDVDGNSTRAFDEFFINCVAKGEPIFWDQML